MFFQTSGRSIRNRLHNLAVTPAASVRELSATTSSKQQHSSSHIEPLTSNRGSTNSDSAPVESKAEIMNDAYWKVAEEYKRLSYILSLGFHNPLKKAFIKKLAPSPGERLLDVAGGTCDIAKCYLGYQDKVNKDRMSTVHVVDFNPGMLSVGKRYLADTQWMHDGRVTFAQGNAENLIDIPDNSFDAYTISFGMHNLENRDKALAEAYRVLKPGGRFACLENGHADSPIMRTFHNWHWYKISPFLVGLLTNSRASYEQLVKSARNFPHQREFVKTIRNAGFYCHGQGYEPMLGGIMVAFLGVKPKYVPQEE
ncbi:ubiquinone/menaquinone [Martensiomyces pterosporus]|nr:ubiquinone/menaquinone [Martensiomyces pterosporus]